MGTDQNKKKQPFAAVVFDMDGVLVDSEPVHYASTVRVMEGEFGIPFSETDDAAFLGSTDRHMWEVLKERHRLSLSVEELIARRKEIYFELLGDSLPWRDGILRLIPDLYRAGYRLAVASSGLRTVIAHVIEEGDFGCFLEAVVSGEDVARPKPAPDIYLEASRQLMLDPAECVAIEDTEFGVRAAHDAGMKVYAFPCPTTQGSDFTLADSVVQTVAEIRDRLLTAKRDISI